MGILTDDMKTVVADTMLCFVATINEDGSPNLSPKSSLRVHDENHLLFANIASPNTIGNLHRDPRIEVNCVDIFSRRGYRFSGLAEVHGAGTALNDQLRSAVRVEHGDAIPVHDAVLIRVVSASPVLSPAYHFIDGISEAALRTAYHSKYGVAPIVSLQDVGSK